MAGYHEACKKRNHNKTLDANRRKGCSALTMVSTDLHLSGYFNHSSEDQANLRLHAIEDTLGYPINVLISKRDIKKGEELTWFYGKSFDEVLRAKLAFGLLTR